MYKYYSKKWKYLNGILHYLKKYDNTQDQGRTKFGTVRPNGTFTKEGNIIWWKY